MAPGLALPPAHAALAQAPATPPLAPAAALAAAKAEAQAGRRAKALSLLRAALPRAGQLAPLLHLEAARLRLHLGQDPYPHLAPLWRLGIPPAIQRQAQELAVDAVQQLPARQARLWAARALPRSLSRRVQAELALRTGNVRAALDLLAHATDDGPAGRLALALARKNLPREAQALVAQALFANGFWPQAQEVLRRLPERIDEPFPLAFTRARVAYRLGAWLEAAGRFEAAAARAPTREDKLSCWLFAARAWEQLGQVGCALEIYERMVASSPEALEGWQGLLLLLARDRGAGQALRWWPKAPEAVREALAPRLCAAFALYGQPLASQAVVQSAKTSDPAVALCAAFLQILSGEGELGRRGLIKLLADPRTGRWRELAALLLPEGQPFHVEPSTALPVLAELAVTKGLQVARQALDLGLRQDPHWAPLLAGTLTRPQLPDELAALLHAGLASEAAALAPRLFPQKTPTELAWSASFLAEQGNLPAALRFGEELWRRLDGVPACLLPDAILSLVVPRALASPLPPHGPRALLWAIARQESAFDNHVTSPVGARGLWQVMPATAQRLGLDPEALSKPELALQLALAHLQEDSRRLGGDPLLLAAAYNAGGQWVSLWLGEHGGPHPLFPVAVPYRETRAYLLAVAEGLWLARHLQ